MNGGLHPEVLLAIGYVVFLIAAAAVLEVLARHTHRRAEHYRLVGFKYHHGLDAWECPAGQHLHRHFTHPEARVLRYRAPARACNQCALKGRCTDSEEGREITRSTFDWLETETGRFHRGISMALLLLAQFILGVELLRSRSSTELWLVVSLLGPLSFFWVKMVTRFSANSASASQL